MCNEHSNFLFYLANKQNFSYLNRFSTVFKDNLSKNKRKTKTTWTTTHEACRVPVTSHILGATCGTRVLMIDEVDLILYN